MKKYILLLCFVMVLLVGCGSESQDQEPIEATSSPTATPTDTPTPTPDTRIEIPDVSEVDFESAKTVLSGKGLLVTSEEIYDDNIEKGLVISTDPESGSKVNESSKVKVYVSKGPWLVESTDSTITWYSIGYEKDEWQFSSPFIMEDYLYIYCEATFGTSFTFKSTGFGNASLTDSFDKYAPVQLLDENLEEFEEGHQVKAGETLKFYFKTSLKQLDTERPTHIAFTYVILNDGVEDNGLVSFNMSWDN